MTNIQEIYLSLLRAAMWETEPVIPQDANIDNLIRVAACHSTAPMIYNIILSADTIPVTPAQKMQMMQVSMQQIQRQMQLLSVLREAVTALEKEHFQPVVLKGFGLASLYPNPHLRPSGDIDLYIGTERFPEACETIMHRFPEAYHPDKMITAGKHYNIEVGDLVIETHRISYGFPDLRRNRLYREMEQTGLKGSLPKAQYEDYEFVIPNPDFNVLFVFLHAWHHFEHSGMNLRQLADWTLLLHRYTAVLNLELLRNRLKQLHMMEAWQAFGWVAVNKLGLPEAEMPFYSELFAKRGEAVFNLLWSDALFGRKHSVHKDKSLRGIAKWWNTFRLTLQNMRWIYPVLPRTALREAVIQTYAAFMHVVFEKEYE